MWFRSVQLTCIILIRDLAGGFQLDVAFAYLVFLSIKI